ncbi:MAG: hypothetical protein A2Z34_03585 [Planctomycetes bacterium RBG_16_59_8]|nr:MAG: hypothetical protein A2Z34_03585 [Planctomycetes bacterium RBG_16_59_8]
MKEISKFSPKVISFFRKQGVFIYGVKNGGNGEESGFFTGDILVSVNGSEIDSLDALKKMYETENKKKVGERKSLCEVIRQGYPKYIVLDFNTKSVDQKEKKE